MDNNSLILIVAFLAIMMFMNFRSSRKRKAEAEQMRAQLVPGAKIVLLSGIVGTVVSVDDEHVILSSAGSSLQVLKGAIRSVSVWESEATQAESTDLPDFVSAESAQEEPVKKTTRTRKPAAPKQTEN